MRSSFLLLSKVPKGPLFPLSCVTDAPSLVKLVRSRTSHLETYLTEQMIRHSPGLGSRSFESDARARAHEKCLPMSTLREKDVEDIVFGKYGLKDNRVVTCLVPYQVAANIILNRLPGEIRAESVAELTSEEEALKAGAMRSKRRSENKWIGWYEQDIYVGDGIRYLTRINAHKRRRVPVFVVAGHVNHGKTTLLDALQSSKVAETESYGITQTVRAFTAAHPLRHRELFTFVDVPGHKLFVETRYHAQRVADCVLLVLSVVEGIQSQTQEAIKVALNLDKPIIVVFTKLDQLSDPFTAQVRVRELLRGLKDAGLDVTMIEKESDLPTEALHSKEREASCPGNISDGESVATRAPLSAFAAADLRFLPMKRIDPAFGGSAWRPVLDLQRKCYGVCVSATRGVNLPILWRLMCEWRDVVNPLCHSNTAGSREHNAAVQAVVVESSKHLFDEEGFRQSKLRRSIQRGLDRAEARHAARREKMSTGGKMNAKLTSSFRQYRKRNRTSTQSLVISVIVREGVVSRGMHFVADQAEGRVDYLLDYWGNSVDQALPGMAVTIVDTNSSSGCPAPGIHVLSVTDEKTQLDIYQYRRMLQWYAEVYTSKLSYLKPRGMDTRFAHLGDYGQLQATHTLEYQLLYGAPPAASASSNGSARSIAGEEQQQQQQQQRLADDGQTSLGSFLAGLNAADEAQMQARLVSVEASGDGALGENAVSIASQQRSFSSQLQPLEERVSQGVVPVAEEEVLDHAWRSLQPTEKITSMEEYERHMRQCVQVGVLLKVDNYHTARMLSRQIPRLGTRKVAFQVVGVRFGPLTIEDIGFFAQTVKVIVCFRNPYAPSMDLDHCIEINDQWVLQTDHFADIATFLKWCAVALHKEYHANDGRLSDRRLYVPDEVDDATPATASVDKEADAALGDGGQARDTKNVSQPRKRRLLVFDSGAD